MLRTIKRRIKHMIKLAVLFIILSCLISCTTAQSNYSGQYIIKPLDYNPLSLQEKELLGIDTLYSPDKQKILMTDKVSNFNTILVNRNGHYDVIFDFKLHFGEHAVRDMYAISYTWKDNDTAYVFNTYADPYPELLEINIVTKQTYTVTLPVDGYLVDYSYVSGNFLFQHYNNSEARSYSLYNLASNTTIELPKLKNMNLHQLHHYDKFFFFLNTQTAQSPVVFDLATSKLYLLTLPTSDDVTYPLVSFLPEQNLVSVLAGDQLHIIDYTSNQTVTIINVDHIEDINNSSFIKWTTSTNPCFYTNINLVCKQ